MNRRDFLKILGLFAISPKKIYAQKSKTKEAVIIGAGIIGSSIAYELSKRGVNVTLIDKNVPGSACSGSSFSWINATYPKKPYSYNLFSQLGINAFHQVQSELSLDIKWNGSLEWSSEKENQEKLVESVHELLSYPKYTPTSIIGHRKAKELEPHINFKGNENIVFSEADGAIDPKDTISKMIEAIKKNGGSVLYPCKFEKIIESNDSFSKIQTSMGVLKSENIIFCNGIDIDDSFNISFLKKPRPGVIIKTEPKKNLINSVVYGPKIHAHQQSNGQLIIGEQITAPIRENSTNHFIRINEHFKNMVKGTSDLDPSEVLIGWRPIPRDELPIIGRFKNKSIYIAVMHSGISLAAIVGNLVTQEIVDEVDSLLLNDFRPSRFF
ncbi:MAG: fructosyl-amino acid oxidase [Flavobacteriaceae bacterium]|nr:fructosyl-amino acid oxidase [Flavobacteriaceae bacterium]|tara:strand:+ start:440 stop:1585 length:1146 start_codon:yes stop_codon:yes gene_type:complete